MRLTKRLCFGGAQAFTLVELLMVIAILGIITVIAIPTFTKYKLRGYKSTLDYDAKSVYISAQAYLTDHVGSTVDTLSKLQSGGYNASQNILLINGAISTSSGNIEIMSNVLKTHGLDNNSVIFSNGRIDLANTPY
jgi:prepilin-type N-terminal cleavage/methylation domain-containing protein